MYALLGISYVLLISPLFASAACSGSNIRERVEWSVKLTAINFNAHCVLLKCANRRMLSDEQKQAYIDAVLCLQNSPAQTGYKGAITRFDDFQAAHIKLQTIIHEVVCKYIVVLNPSLISKQGQFLPWHRVGRYLSQWQFH
jgi:hypothetical protein